jgi:hypothetical protein
MRGRQGGPEQEREGRWWRVASQDDDDVRPEQCVRGNSIVSTNMRACSAQKKLTNRKEGPRVWPSQRLGLDAHAIVVEREHSGWLLRPQGPQ